MSIPRKFDRPTNGPSSVNCERDLLRLRLGVGAQHQNAENQNGDGVQHAFVMTYHLSRNREHGNNLPTRDAVGCLCVVRNNIPSDCCDIPHRWWSALQ